MDSSPSPETRMLLRAQWLHSLSQPEREALFELSLREVDDRFAAWLDAHGDPQPG